MLRTTFNSSKKGFSPLFGIMAITASVLGISAIILVSTFQGSLDDRPRAYQPTPTPEVILPPGQAERIQEASLSPKVRVSPQPVQAQPRGRAVPIPSAQPLRY